MNTLQTKFREALVDFILWHIDHCDDEWDVTYDMRRINNFVETWAKTLKEDRDENISQN